MAACAYGTDKCDEEGVGSRDTETDLSLSFEPGLSIAERRRLLTVSADQAGYRVERSQEPRKRKGDEGEEDKTNQREQNRIQDEEMKRWEN